MEMEEPIIDQIQLEKRDATLAKFICSALTTCMKMEDMYISSEEMYNFIRHLRQVERDPEIFETIIALVKNSFPYFFRGETIRTEVTAQVDDDYIISKILWNIVMNCSLGLEFIFLLNQELFGGYPSYPRIPVILEDDMLSDKELRVISEFLAKNRPCSYEEVGGLPIRTRSASKRILDIMNFIMDRDLFQVISYLEELKDIHAIFLEETGEAGFFNIDNRDLPEDPLLIQEAKFQLVIDIVNKYCNQLDYLFKALELVDEEKYLEGELDLEYIDEGIEYELFSLRKTNFRNLKRKGIIREDTDLKSIINPKK